MSPTCGSGKLNLARQRPDPQGNKPRMFASRSGKPPDGHGICYWRNGAKKYEGQWKNGNPHGHGLFIDLDGNVFEGEWQNGQMHGKGMCVTPDGEKYEGDFQNGTMHGNGIFTYPDGEKYEGQWQNGLMHGKGLTTWPNGQKYEGDYVEGEKHGCGVFTWQNGDKYDGQWQDDMMHGCGILMDRDYNIIHAGTWVDDEYVQDVRISYLDQCCICMDDIVSGQDILTTGCNHVFHSACCEDWARRRGTCPVCVSRLSSFVATGRHDMASSSNY